MTERRCGGSYDERRPGGSPGTYYGSTGACADVQNHTVPITMIPYLINTLQRRRIGESVSQVTKQGFLGIMHAQRNPIQSFDRQKGLKNDGASVRKGGASCRGIVTWPCCAASPDAGASACTPCPAGSYSASTGAALWLCIFKTLDLSRSRCGSCCTAALANELKQYVPAALSLSPSLSLTHSHSLYLYLYISISISISISRFLSLAHSLSFSPSLALSHYNSLPPLSLVMYF
jgi:hypothetical protein